MDHATPGEARTDTMPSTGFGFLSWLLVALVASLQACGTVLDREVEGLDRPPAELPTGFCSVVDASLEFVAIESTLSSRFSDFDHEDLFISKHEVSARDFLRFVLARQGEEEAKTWAAEHELDLLADLPYPVESKDEMVAYCRWLRGRVPTFEEYWAIVRNQYGESWKEWTWGVSQVLAGERDDVDEFLPILSEFNLGNRANFQVQLSEISERLRPGEDAGRMAGATSPQLPARASRQADRRLRTDRQPLRDHSLGGRGRPRTVSLDRLRVPRHRRQLGEPRS